MRHRGRSAVAERYRSAADAAADQLDPQNEKGHEHDHGVVIGHELTVGDCYDNAPMESFWGSMQIELLNRQKWRTNLELAVAMADYIDHFYNPIRRHSSLDYLTPNEFEDLHSPKPQATLS